jgi:hypothetical protein
MHVKCGYGEMLRISWREKRTNDEVCKEIGIENKERLRQTMLRRKLGFFEHVMRSNGMEKNDAGEWRRQEKTRKTKKEMNG